MDIVNNLDLLSVGMTIAGIGVLGFVVYFNNTKSITSRTFLLLALLTIFWSITNYLYYTVESSALAFWLIRLVIFFAVWHTFSFFQLARVFPNDRFKFSKIYKWLLIPAVAITSITTLTPLVFKQIAEVSKSGQIEKIENGPLISLFGIVVVGLVIGGIIMLFRKTANASGKEKIQTSFVLIGTFLTFLLILIFNFILPAFFDNSRFIPLGAVFIIPYVGFTSYSILKYKLFDIKIIATAILAFVLSIVTFIEIIFSDGFEQIMFRSGVFILVLVFSIFLLKSVRKEVALREKVEELAESLSDANIRLKKLDKMKSEFMSFATHQIRAPLTAIKGYTSMILEGSYGDVSDEARGAIDKVYQSSQKLVMVVEDYLNISRIETGGMKYSFSAINLGKLVRDITVEQMPNIEKSGLKLIVDIGEDKRYRAEVDEGKIRQVFTNLIDNAIKYTKKGSISVSVYEDLDKGKLVVKVSDTGIGISKKTMSKLFQKFMRADDASEANIHGTGLGLYIAKQITMAHKGGKLWAESQGEGNGSQFYVEVDGIK